MKVSNLLKTISVGSISVLAVSTVFVSASSNEHRAIKGDIETHTLRLDKSCPYVKDGDKTTFSSKTDEGTVINFDSFFLAEGDEPYIYNPKPDLTGEWGCLKADWQKDIYGYITNTTPIGGIKSITIKSNGCSEFDGGSIMGDTFDVYWGWEVDGEIYFPETAKETIRKSRTTRLTECTFSNEYPSFFRLKNTYDFEWIDSIIIEFSCVESEMPEYYSSDNAASQMTFTLQNGMGGMESGYYLSKYTETNHFDVVDIPETYKGVPVVGIMEHAFVDLNGESIVVNVPEGVKHIRAQAFSSCTAITTINLPSTLSQLGNLGNSTNFIYDCQNLTTLNLNENCSKFICYNHNAIVEASTHTLMSILNSGTIPEDTITIGSHAFACTSHAKIRIPTSVKYINANAFDTLSNLEMIYIPSTVFKIEINALYNCKSNANIYIELDSDAANWANTGTTYWYGSDNYNRQYGISREQADILFAD